MLTYGDLEDKLVVTILGVERVENAWQLFAMELHVDDGSNDGVNAAITNTLSAGESLSDSW